MHRSDVLVIGGGIAGVSAGYDRQLTAASRSFFENPPEGFDGPLLLPRPLLWLGPVGTGGQIRALAVEVRPLVPSVRLLDPDEAVAIHPLLRREFLELCMLEPGAMELDVNALQQSYVRGLRKRGGEIHASSGVVALARSGGLWRAATRSGEKYEAPIIVNASGAWGDEVATLAGVIPVGLHPLRRTLFTIGAPEGTDVARALDRIREATILEPRHVRASWAGLRTFTGDRAPVACYDPENEGFFWLVGQGGYGIQTAPALARMAAALVRGKSPPDDIAGRGLQASHLHRDRLEGCIRQRSGHRKVRTVLPRRVIGPTSRWTKDLGLGATRAARHLTLAPLPTGR